LAALLSTLLATLLTTLVALLVLLATLVLAALLAALVLLSHENILCWLEVHISTDRMGRRSRNFKILCTS
jgi:hypothetical protein